MSDSQLFNLEKIKEFTFPIQELQVELNQLSKYSNIFKKNIDLIEKDLVDEHFLTQVEDIRKLLEKLNEIFNKISKDNINKFLDFEDWLIKNYKENFKDNLMKFYLNKNLSKQIGLFLIEDNKISKIINHISFIPSIEIPQWLELLKSLKYNTLFLKSVEKLKIFYQGLLQNKLKRELSKIPNKTNPALIKEYKKNFHNNPDLTFSKYLRDIESKLTQTELKAKKKIREKTIENEKFEILKKTQEEHRETYDDYIKLSNREFERLRRKKDREKLIDISVESKKEKKNEISDEISQKIQNFKSQFEKSFEEKYLVQKNDDEDPIDLVRERKKKKEKEYKKYKNHFENA